MSDGFLSQKEIDELLGGIGDSGTAENDKKNKNVEAAKPADDGITPVESFADFDDDNPSSGNCGNSAAPEPEVPQLSPQEIEQLIESCHFPLKLMIEDGEVSGSEIKRGNFAPPSPDKFRGKKGSLMLGSTEIASVIIGADSKDGLYAEVAEVVTDNSRNFSLSEALFNYPLTITVEMGRKNIPLDQARSLTHGTVIPLDKLAGEPADLLLENSDVVIARGEILLIDENFGIRITELANFDIPGILGGKVRAERRISGEAEIPLRLVLGRRSIETGNLLKICKGTILELDRKSHEHLELADGDSLRLNAEVCVVDGHFGARIVAYDKNMIPEPSALSKSRADALKNQSLEIEKLMESAEQAAESLSVATQYRPFGFLDKIPPERIVNLVQQENPQVIALVISFLDPALSSLVMSGLPYNIMCDVTERLVFMKTVPSRVMKRIEHALLKKLKVMAEEDNMDAGISVLLKNC